MGSVRLYGATSGYLELQAPDVSPDAALVLPSDSLQPGLVHVHTETFSAQSSVSIDDVFDATYDNYRMVISYFKDSGNLRARLRAGGTDDTTASSYVSQYLLTSGSGLVDGVVVDNYWGISEGRDETNVASVDLYRPALAQRTGFTSNVFAFGSGGDYVGVEGGRHSQTTAFDGITLFGSSGTMTGTVRVYGYRNS